MSMARHSEPEPRRGTIMRCEAQRIAANIAKLPEPIEPPPDLGSAMRGADRGFIGNPRGIGPSQ
jgi:hypothetical protein